MSYQSTKLIELGSCAFRQFGATHSHCHLVHGYQLKAKFYFGCSELDSNNWSVDFGGLKQLKQILNDQFDHTLCIAENDPLLEVFQHLHNLGGCNLKIMSGVGIEKTAEWCFNAATQFLKDTYGDRCWVEKVEVYEHENNSAIYLKPATIAAPEQVQVITTSIPSEENTSVQASVEPVTPNHPVNVGNSRVTSGYSGLFDGISWGSR
ncbi:6-pyruvoyl tetrahydropterin synthase/QueD family protein [uncultured Caudovirales phage]|uniref:6-pyruvoyl tetrahydropterin synthase/QueD family protein n=1 Tax=uncultured Caudovirales phage TaxID=2100421 RepID=A0A6J7X721_9CAUD|nr:6-pyruvoyl tetrahydropterin synthase/QueD family protein [uncultured Caudovirales phage]